MDLRNNVQLLKMDQDPVKTNGSLLSAVERACRLASSCYADDHTSECLKLMEKKGTIFLIGLPRGAVEDSRWLSNEKTL